jgi:hypothetical protein
MESGKSINGGKMQFPFEDDCQPNERVYQDLTDLGSRYVRYNVDLLPAIARNYNLVALDLLLLFDIIGYYDSNGQTPCKYSYDDLADKYRYSRPGIQKSLNILISNKLIIKLGTNRGRAKSEYIPNVLLIHNTLIEYIRKYKPENK